MGFSWIGIRVLGGERLSDHKELSLSIRPGLDPAAHPILQQHCCAIQQYSQQQRRAAIQTWQGVLAQSPTDLLALKFLTTACFFVGDVDTMAQVCHACVDLVPSPDRHHVWAMLAFALVEKGDTSMAERYACRALHWCCHSPWALHALLHVYLEQARIIEGIELLSGNHQQWRQHSDLSCHLYWHWAIFSLHHQDIAEALAIYDGEVFPRVMRTGGFPMDVADAVSLLVRFDMLDVMGVTGRWSALNEAIRHEVPLFLSNPFTASHLFILSHFSSALDGPYRTAPVLDREPSPTLVRLYSGLHAYLQEEYDTAFQDLFAVCSSLRCLGGSNAQRDLFILIAIDAASRCGRDHLALALLTGRTPISIRNKVKAKAWSHFGLDSAKPSSIDDSPLHSFDIDAFRYKAP